MGFNKKYLPSLEEFKKILETNPDYIKYCWKADALIGPAETLDYIDEEWKKLQEKEKSKG